MIAEVGVAAGRGLGGAQEAAADGLLQRRLLRGPCERLAYAVAGETQDAVGNLRGDASEEELPGWGVQGKEPVHGGSPHALGGEIRGCGGRILPAATPALPGASHAGRLTFLPREC